MAATTSSAPRAISSRLGLKTSAFVAALVGMAILFIVGFARPLALHDAAHDARHGVGFPCH